MQVPTAWPGPGLLSACGNLTDPERPGKRQAPEAPENRKSARNQGALHPRMMLSALTDNQTGLGNKALMENNI